MSEGNGSEGRFLRIENKLDGVVEDIGDLKVAMARVETAISTKIQSESQRVSLTSYKWMKYGIIASFCIGVASLVGRILGLSL